MRHKIFMRIVKYALKPINKVVKSGVFLIKSFIDLHYVKVIHCDATQIIN